MRVAVDANTILSGLFFRGNERTLLLASLRKEVVLVFAEDVVDEVYAVAAETFRDHADFPGRLHREIETRQLQWYNEWGQVTIRLSRRASSKCY